MIDFIWIEDEVGHQVLLKAETFEPTGYTVFPLGLGWMVTTPRDDGFMTLDFDDEDEAKAEAERRARR